jgi:hypothetical protein
MYKAQISSRKEISARENFVGKCGVRGTAAGYLRFIRSLKPPFREGLHGG